MKTLLNKSLSKSALSNKLISSNLIITFYPVILIWIIVGMYLGIVVNVFVLSALAVWSYQKRFSEILFGFIFILLLSDNRDPAFLFAVTTKMIYILAITLIFLIHLPKFKPFSKIIVLFIPFFIFAFFALTKSPSLFPSLMRTASYFLLLLTIPNLVQKVLKTKREQFLYDFCTFIFVILAIGLALFVVAPGIVVPVAGRYAGLLGNPNGLGIFLLMYFLIFNLTLFYFPKIFKKKTKILIYFVIGTSLLLCRSRTAIFTVLLFILFKETYKVSKLLGFLLFVIIIVSVQLFISNVGAIVTALNLQDYLRLETLSTGSGRIFAFDIAWEAIQADPFVGRGFGYTTELFNKFHEELSLLNHQGNVHNSYLTIWLDVGLWGVITFILAWFGYFIKWSKDMILAIPILYSVIFSTFFESWLSASLNPYTILLVILISIIYTYSEVDLSRIKKTKKVNYRRVKLRT